jgi:simple sugar transport system ATP-binding protein
MGDFPIPAPTAAPLLALRGVGKKFPGVTALDGVDFTVRAGEIHALLGENGAGKSTLIKVLTGVHEADAGEIRLNGTPIRPASPADAERAGISTVYQEVNLVPSLSVAENLVLGRQPGRGGFVNWSAARRRARAALARLGLELDVDTELGTLSVAVQQLVALARALEVKAKLLILDEPTASLDEKEVADLFAILRRLRAEGLGIVFVTHFLDQVYAVCDRITVLRNGTLVGEWPVAELPHLALVGKMLGRELAASAGSAAPAAAASAAAPVLAARGLARRGALHPLDLSVARGEVLGLAGLLGSGRTETARLLFGVDTRDAGEIAVNGRPTGCASPRDAIAAGLAFCSEDRKTEGILPNLSVRENLIVALQAKQGGWRVLSRAEQDRLCAHYLAALPQLIILDEPTRGIDIGAKAEIEALIARLRAEGIAVIFISSELEEIIRNSTRVTVLRERRAAGELTGADISAPRVMQAMAGGHSPHA